MSCVQFVFVDCVQFGIHHLSLSCFWHRARVLEILRTILGLSKAAESGVRPIGLDTGKALQRNAFHLSRVDDVVSGIVAGTDLQGVNFLLDTVQQARTLSLLVRIGEGELAIIGGLSLDNILDRNGVPQLPVILKLLTGLGLRIPSIGIEALL